MGVSGGSKTALVAISRPGLELALRLQRFLPDAEIFLPQRFTVVERANIHHWSAPLAGLFQRLFAEYGGIVLFGSVGMSVRLIAPLIGDKRTDPAVVVVDDAGRFAVSVLSGHLGGANALATQVAAILGAQPVITTASDTLGTLAVDLLGRDFGWRIEGGRSVTQVSAALVNGEPVGLLQEAGESDWWPQNRPLPPNITPFSTLDDLVASHCQAALVITDRLIAEWIEILPPSVVYRPRSLVVGVGCNRGAGAEEVALAVKLAVEDQGLAPASIRNLATLDVKRDDVGIEELAARWKVPVEYYSAEELDSVATVPNPSATVRGKVGTRGVCEPAALLSAGADRLVVPKLKTSNVTVAVARVDFSKKGRS